MHLFGEAPYAKVIIFVLLLLEVIQCRISVSPQVLKLEESEQTV